jgi:hypothetical protein
MIGQTGQNRTIETSSKAVIIISALDPGIFAAEGKKSTKASQQQCRNNNEVESEASRVTSLSLSLSLSLNLLEYK